jgi:hypothetical protein
MGNRYVFELTKRVLSALRTRRAKGYSKGLGYCHHCRREFREGDVVVSVPSIRKRKWYCLPCARRLGIWFEWRSKGIVEE